MMTNNILFNIVHFRAGSEMNNQVGKLRTFFSLTQSFLKSLSIVVGYAFTVDVWVDTF